MRASGGEAMAGKWRGCLGPKHGRPLPKAALAAAFLPAQPACLEATTTAPVLPGHLGRVTGLLGASSFHPVKVHG